MSAGVGKLGLSLYLTGLLALSAVSIGGLYATFLADFPAFLREFLADPPGAVQADPATAGIFVATMAAMAGLVALIVLFGATYGPAPAEQQ